MATVTLSPKIPPDTPIPYPFHIFSQTLSGNRGWHGPWKGAGRERSSGVRAPGSRGAGGHHLFQGVRTTHENEALSFHACSTIPSDFAYKIQIQRHNY